MKKKIIISLVTVSLCFLVCAFPVHAYIGPGTGAGVVAVVLGLLGSIFLAIVGILWYPLKRMIKKFKKTVKIPIQEIVATNGLDSNNCDLHHISRINPVDAFDENHPTV